MNSVTESIKDSFSILSEYYSDDGERKAYLIDDQVSNQRTVHCYCDSKSGMLLDRIIDVTGHSVCYGEDAAENWVTYVIR